MKKTSILLSLAIANLITVAHAAPDAGQTMQQLQQKPLVVPKTDKFTITAPALAADTPAGGEQIEITRILFSGTTKFKVAHLIEHALGGNAVVGKSHDLATIKKLANQVSMYYRNNGYPFARAFIPAQTIEDGVLQIKVVEGQYGKVMVTGDDKTLNQQAQAFLSSLKSGDVIESSTLERATLLLSDQAGVQTSPIVQPGSDTGSGDLIVDIKRSKPYTANIGFDNHGNRYTGNNKASANLAINSPFMLGDQITISGLYSDEQMWFGNVGYNLPLNGTGLRANIGYAHTYYQLGKNLSALDAKGTADTLSAGLSYSLIRSQKTNVNLSGTLQHKNLNDDLGNNATSNQKTSNSIPLGVSFDSRDSFGGGGITFGSVMWTKGSLELNDALKANDTNTNTHGDFDKANLDLARMQAVQDKLALYVRGSAQWSNKNLDSSEGFGIGGISGVRAYPTGEGYGNVGWVTQTELRYTLNENFAPYAFYDVGSSTTNQTTVAANPIRDISGAGIGLRYTQDVWSSDISAAWRMNGGRPSDASTPDDAPRLWASVRYQM